METTNDYIILRKRNYTIAQLNKLLPSGFDDKCTYTHTGSDIILGHYFVNKFLEIHCDIIEKSISNHQTEKYLHRDDDVLCVIKCDNEGQYIPNDVKYIPLNAMNFKNIKLSITDQDGNKVVCD
ncbi:Uncharacterized protein FWK35_00035556, partial [Aphis craccivora]